jgi:hypothetical protein
MAEIQKLKRLPLAVGLAFLYAGPIKDRRRRRPKNDAEPTETLQIACGAL